MAPRLVGGSPPHQSMASQHKARGVQPGLPADFRPDRRRVVEQTVFFLLLGQPGELGVEGMIGRQERLLAMEDRRVGARCVIEAVDLAGADRELDAAPESRVRVGREIGIVGVRYLREWRCNLIRLARGFRPYRRDHTAVPPRAELVPRYQN
jgi:hypothetical protein